MIVGVVSDTHLPKFGRMLPAPLMRGLRESGVELILHAGDLTEAFVLELFEQIAPVIAVGGNNDGKALRLQLGERRIVEAENVRIGLVHGHAGSQKTTRDRALHAFDGDKIDAIVFGHSHIPYNHRHDGILLFNPGSPTDKRFNPRYTYGVLRIEGSRIEARHRYYWKKA
ncbi:MAG: metallophosphoesterase family protein [Vulcanimicrobiaceae bacterium]